MIFDHGNTRLAYSLLWRSILFFVLLNSFTQLFLAFILSGNTGGREGFSAILLIQTVFVLLALYMSFILSIASVAKRKGFVYSFADAKSIKPPN